MFLYSITATTKFCSLILVRGNENVMQSFALFLLYFL